MEFVVLLMVIAGGAGIGLQTPTNVSMGKLVGPLESGWLNFVIGSALAFVVVLLFGSGDLRGIVDAPLWQCIGGVYGAVCVVVGIYAAPVLGVALFATLLTVGQLGSGIIIDYFGLAGVAVSELSEGRIAGFTVVFCGIALFYIGRRSSRSSIGADVKADESKTPKGKTVLASLCTFLSGAAAAFQGPTNAGLALHTGTLEAAFVSFFGGFILLTLIVVPAMRGRLKAPRGAKPWQLLGGIYGVFLVVCNMLGTVHLGVGVAMACVMLGQFAMGLAIDSWGLLHSPRIPLNKWRVFAVVLVALGLAVTCIARL